MADHRHMAFALTGLLLWVVFSMETVRAAATREAEETASCLACHAQSGPKMTLGNGETIPVRVDPESFSTSVHNFLPCTGCHEEFSGSHPERSFRSKRAYRIRTNRVCRRCHSGGEFLKIPIHEDLLAQEQEGRAMICTDCHSAHAVQPVSGGRVFASEERSCLECHGYELTLNFKNRETLSLYVDTAELHASAHEHLSCSDCHFGFSSESHVHRIFKSRRDFALASAAVCRRCHFDKYTKTSESIHSEMISRGNLSAPTCTDCHGSHAVAYVSDDRGASAGRCRSCHGTVYDIYAKSVHGAALLNENNRDVPVCADCHSAHEIRDPLTREYHERIPELCSRCHSDERIAGRYGLSTDVVKTYLEDFHGVTLGFYRKQKDGPPGPQRAIAVCTDCHGTHNITRTTGPDANVVKSNLVKKCRKCHEDATDDFPDIWLSHYVPSFQNAPLVFAVNTAYKVFLPLMVAGLLLQILLHVWRYLVSR